MFSSGYGELFHHLTSVQRSVPLVVTLHDRFPASYYAPEALVGRNLRAADWTAACSAAVLATARQSVPEIADCSSVIWNSVPMPALAGDSRAADPRRLLYAGRLVRQKGVDILLAAFAELKHRYPNLTLDIVGDGPERSALEAEVARLAMTSVVFHGIVSRDQVYMHINKAALVIVPSRFEPFGLVALEAAQMARPVVASDVDGLAEVVERGETGLLVPPDDAQALAIAIASLLDAPERAVTMGKVAQRRAVACFGWEHFLDGYDELFRRLARET
jgi:glycogen(starch) synthase